MAINFDEVVKALQIPEGKTVRNINGVLKVVAAVIRKIVKKENIMQEEESLESRNRRHLEAIARMEAERAAKEAEKEQQYAQAFANPPTLRGSEKQIEWASKIRNAFIEFYKDSRRKYCGDDVLAHQDASWWIDNRYGMGVTNSDQRAIQSLMY